MKFTQLKIGQRFSYRGEIFRKATPLMADPEGEGGQRLIPRSASVEPLEAPLGQVASPSEIPVVQIERSMGQLAKQITAIIRDSGMETAQVNALLRQLQAAFLQARRSLNLP